jgi:hypothetical protein
MAARTSRAGRAGEVSWKRFRPNPVSLVEEMSMVGSRGRQTAAGNLERVDQVGDELVEGVAGKTL